jgi:hypothetical protein
VTPGVVGEQEVDVARGARPAVHAHGERSDHRVPYSFALKPRRHISHGIDHARVNARVRKLGE